MAGLVFAKAILLVAENVLIVNEALDFYFPTLAIVVTFLSFIVLFFCISLFVSFILRTKRLNDLIKGEKQSKGEPKASILLAIVAALLLITGYFTALYVKGVYVVYVMIPVVIVVTIGTYLLFTQLSVFIIRLLKRNQLVFWRKTNMLLFSDLSFRMKDNARTFFMVAIISTVAFSAIGTLYGFQSYLTKEIKVVNPYSFSYTPYQEDNQEVIENDINKVNAILDEENIETKMAEIELHYFELPVRNREVLIAKASDYNRFAALIAEEELYPEEYEAIVVEQSGAILMQGQKASEALMNTTIRLENGQEVFPSRVVDTEVLPEINGYYVVNDKIYEQLSSPSRSNVGAVWQASEGQTDQVIDAGRKIEEQIGYKVIAIDHTIYTINKAFGPILFIGLFIGIVFFVSAGSFLYFRLFTDLDEEKRKFRSIAKIGLTQSELKKVVTRQIAILFFSPIIVALVHGAVALTALSHFFDYHLIIESTLVLSSFAVIQIIYFLLARYFYLKQVERAVL